MFNLHKKKKGTPAFGRLYNYRYRDSYFVRTSRWYWDEHKKIVIVNNESANAVRLGSSHQQIFLDANGKMTIKEYIQYLADFYKERIPENLDEIIIHQLDDLLEKRLIEISERSREVEQPYARPLQ